MELKQGCVLPPMLFSMMFSAMLSNVFNEDEHGIKVINLTDGKFFNLKKLQAKSKVEGVLVRDFLFSGDCALSAASVVGMQQTMDQFTTAGANFGLITPRKHRCSVSHHHTIHMWNHQFQQMEKF